MNTKSHAAANFDGDRQEALGTVESTLLLTPPTQSVRSARSDAIEDRGRREAILVAEDQPSAGWMVADGTTVGRAPGNDILVDDPTVSAHHAQFVMRTDAWCIVDLDSTNGTFVDERRIREQRLAGRRLLRFGTRRFQFIDGTPGRRAQSAGCAPTTGEAENSEGPSGRAQDHAAGTAGPNGLVTEARRLIADRVYVDAERLVGTALEHDPQHRDALYLLGFLQYQRGDYPSSVSTLQALVRLDPNRHTAWYTMGLGLAQQERLTDAADAMERTLALEPSYSAARDKLAQYREQLRSLGSAEAMRSAAPTTDAGSSLAGELALGRATPGELLFQGHRLLRSYWRRIVVSIACLAAAYVFWDRSAELNEQVRRATGEEVNPGALVAVTPAIVAGLLLLHAAVSVMLTRFTIYERRVDITKGILLRVHESVWLWELTDVALRQPLSLSLVRTGVVYLKTDNGEHQLVAPTNFRGVRHLFADLRDRSIRERRAMKQLWV